ncbi:zinc finger protein [Aphelenchoides avenae]|nr:zinc finger protein [Aphelenchus avenae]
MAWRNHQRNHKEFPCPQCDYVARRRDHLRSHVLTRHENDKPYKCSECDFSTVYHSNYKNHVAMHSEQRSNLAGPSQQQDAGLGEASEWISSIFEYVDDSTANAVAPSPPSGSAKGSATSVEKFVIIPSEQAPPKRKRSKRSTTMAPVVTTASNGTRVNVDQYFANPPYMPKAEEMSEISQLAQVLEPVSPTGQGQCKQMGDMVRVTVQGGHLRVLL